MTSLTGGCSCGRVRLNANAEPTFVAVCHCRACQRASGSAFAMIVALPADALHVTGEVTTYDSKGDSGRSVHYRFCPNCGSPVSSNVDVIPDTIMIRAGILDDPSRVKPGMEIYCDSQQTWVALAGDMQRFAKMPG